MVTDIENLIKEISEPIVVQEDMFLVDIEFHRGKDSVVWIYVDSEKSGVDVEACSRISREVGFLLDANEVIENKYRLNVSSPGLSRPLSDARQYPKNIGRMAKVNFRVGDKTEQVEGVMTSFDGSALEIETGSKKRKEKLTIAVDDILEARIIPKIK